MIVLTPEELLDEVHALIADRMAVALGLTEGGLLGEGLSERTYPGSRDRRWTWILQAHVGTLNKLAMLLPNYRTPTTAELLVVARNLFENLVWLRLFELNAQEGVTFYAQLLKDQKQDVERTIAKVSAEADLFDAASKEDLAIVGDAFSSIGKDGKVSKTDIDAANEEERRRHRDLDTRIRTGFTLFGSAARYNGYGWQAHLIRTKDVPKRQAHLAKIDQLINEFEIYIGDAGRLADARRRWVWRNEAVKVGMVDDYDFLYAWTSRLLHSTPMNIITEKELLDPEQIMLLEYIAITVRKVIDNIEGFTFPGRHNIMSITVDGEGREPAVRS